MVESNRLQEDVFIYLFPPTSLESVDQDQPILSFLLVLSTLINFYK